jgi:hypothetical protein
LIITKTEYFLKNFPVSVFIIEYTVPTWVYSWYWPGHWSLSGRWYELYYHMEID